MILFVVLKVKTVTVFEYEKGLMYSHGKFKRFLDTGTHWYIQFFKTVKKADTRQKFISITGQEILSSDGVTLKISLAAQYEIADLNIAINKLGNPYEEALHLVLQLALREIVGATKIDDILEQRNALSQQLMEKATKKVADLGLKLISADIKDIMFPGELKKIFSQVAKSRQEGLAILEKARGETAALRSLNNIAGMLKDNPTLLQLRALYSSGNIILTIPGANTTFPVNTQSNDEAGGAKT